MYITKQLNISHKKDIYQHLIALDNEDKYNRFCAQMTDYRIDYYVEHINYSLDGLFGIFNDKLVLVGFSHIALNPEKTKAEFAFSILRQEQGKGLGNILMKKAVLFAKSKGIQEIQMNCLASNHKSLHLAKKHGLKVKVAEYGEKTAILETAHPQIDRFFAQNQIILENYFADLHFMHLFKKNGTKNLSIQNK